MQMRVSHYMRRNIVLFSGYFLCCPYGKLAHYRNTYFFCNDCLKGFYRQSLLERTCTTTLLREPLHDIQDTPVAVSFKFIANALIVHTEMIHDKIQDSSGPSQRKFSHRVCKVVSKAQRIINRRASFLGLAIVAHSPRAEPHHSPRSSLPCSPLFAAM